MKNQALPTAHLAAIILIFLGATAAWHVLGSATESRTKASTLSSSKEVHQIWGSPQEQLQPTAWYLSPTGKQGRRTIQPDQSDVRIDLKYSPKKKGLLWHRTFEISFEGIYEISNPTPIEQVIYVQFPLPSEDSSYQNFSFSLGDQQLNDQIPHRGMVTQARTLAAGESVPLTVSYFTRGTKQWNYSLGALDRVRNFKLSMTTDFEEIDFPGGTSSPSTRELTSSGGWNLEWNYPDVIHPQSIGMAMPKALNAGPVTQRISFFAPLSLLFFFAVVLILGWAKGVNLHPMNYFFVAAGFFAFHLLLAYLADLLSLHLSFACAAITSLALVLGYLRAVGGRELIKIALPAQIAYLILFSYSFFFDGLSGITITIGAIATLAILMIKTAGIDWSAALQRKSVPIPAPPLPTVDLNS